MPLATHQWTSQLEVAREAAEAAALLVREAMASGKERDIKAKAMFADLVTDIDLASDQKIRDILGEAFPDAFLLTEETYKDEQPLDLQNTWVVDPIDGTTNIAHGIPHFCISIAYFYQGQPVVGLIHQPLTQQTYWTVKGEGAWLGDKRLQVSRTNTLNDALLATGFPKDKKITVDTNIPAFLHFLERSHGVRRMGSAALDLAFLASGYYEALWELKLSIWDVAAGALMIEEAGGRFLTLSGEPFAWDSRQVNMVATNAQPGIETPFLEGLNETLPNIYK